MKTENEIWKVVANTDGKYEVSTLGRIRTMWRLTRLGRRYNINPPQILKASQCKNGYWRIVIRDGNLNKHWPLHRLVLMTFNPEDFSDGLHAAHLDGNVNHNNIENLEWATAQENANHKFEHGTTNKGEKSRQAKLSEVAALAVKRLAEAGIPYKTIAAAFGIAEPTVSSIKGGHTWKHL